jgi:hypothetical protein
MKFIILRQLDPKARAASGRLAMKNPAAKENMMTDLSPMKTLSFFRHHVTVLTCDVNSEPPDLKL